MCVDADIFGYLRRYTNDRGESVNIYLYVYGVVCLNAVVKIGTGENQGRRATRDDRPVRKGIRGSGR